MNIDLYVDDTGSRALDLNPGEAGRIPNAFGLGGFLIEAERTWELAGMLEAFKREHGIDCTIHSVKIRNRQGPFSWMQADPERAHRFMEGCSRFLAAAPIVVLACAVHRPGYFERYQPRYGDGRWKLCKSAYTILVERAAKFAATRGRRLKVYVEATGKHEDNASRSYHRDLHARGMYFDPANSSGYTPMDATQFASVLVQKKPDFITKANPLCQVADLVLYPVVRGRYEPTYRPYRDLITAGKIIDMHLPPEERWIGGVKYYCFDGFPEMPELEGSEKQVA